MKIREDRGLHGPLKRKLVDPCGFGSSGFNRQTLKLKPSQSCSSNGWNTHNETARILEKAVILSRI